MNNNIVHNKLVARCDHRWRHMERLGSEHSGENVKYQSKPQYLLFFTKFTAIFRYNFILFIEVGIV